MELEGTVCIFHNFNKIAELEIALFISSFSVNKVLHLNEYKDSLHWVGYKNIHVLYLNILRSMIQSITKNPICKYMKQKNSFKGLFHSILYIVFFFWGCKLCYRSNSNKTNTRYEDTSSLFLPKNRMESIVDASL